MAHAFKHHLDPCYGCYDIEGACISEMRDPEYLAFCMSLPACCGNAVFYPQVLIYFLPVHAGRGVYRRDRATWGFFCKHIKPEGLDSLPGCMRKPFMSFKGVFEPLCLDDLQAFVNPMIRVTGEVKFVWFLSSCFRSFLKLK